MGWWSKISMVRWRSNKNKWSRGSCAYFTWENGEYYKLYYPMSHWHYKHKWLAGHSIIVQFINNHYRVKGLRKDCTSVLSYWLILYYNLLISSLNCLQVGKSIFFWRYTWSRFWFKKIIRNETVTELFSIWNTIIYISKLFIWNYLIFFYVQTKTSMLEIIFTPKMFALRFLRGILKHRVRKPAYNVLSFELRGLHLLAWKLFCESFSEQDFF